MARPAARGAPLAEGEGVGREDGDKHPQIARVSRTQRSARKTCLGARPTGRDGKRVFFILGMDHAAFGYAITGEHHI